MQSLLVGPSHNEHFGSQTWQTFVDDIMKEPSGHVNLKHCPFRK
jgi:hypothetical protein